MCVSQCQPRYVKIRDTGNCLACPFDCYTCDNLTKCLTCNNSADFRIYNPTSKRCVPLDGYYENNVTIAALCPTNCSLCQSLTFCLNCSKGYLGPNQLCGDCPERYFSNNVTKICIRCPYDCYTCDGNNKCLSCGASDFRTLTGSRCVANQGYYDDGVNAMSVKCSPTCFACNSSNTCTQCYQSSFLDLSSQCVQNCGVRFFINTTILKCQSCPYDCYTCDSSGLLCSTCNFTTDFRTINLTSMRCVPSDGFYESSITVSAPCPTCCATCTSSTQCTSCKTSCYLNLNFSCLTSCPNRFFKDNSTWRCVSCPYDCLTCDANRSCLTCSTDDYRTLVGNRCIPVLGYYENSAQIAAQCSAICSNCTTFTYCNLCTNGFLLRDDNRCYSTCLSSSYSDNATLSCKACPSTCALCQNSTYCTVCTIGNYLRLDNMCVSTCP